MDFSKKATVTMLLMATEYFVKEYYSRDRVFLRQLRK